MEKYKILLNILNLISKGLKRKDKAFKGKLNEASEIVGAAIKLLDIQAIGQKEDFFTEIAISSLGKKNATFLKHACSLILWLNENSILSHRNTELILREFLSISSFFATSLESCNLIISTTKSLTNHAIESYDVAQVYCHIMTSFTANQKLTNVVETAENAIYHLSKTVIASIRGVVEHEMGVVTRVTASPQARLCTALGRDCARILGGRKGQCEILKRSVPTQSMIESVSLPCALSISHILLHENMNYIPEMMTTLSHTLLKSCLSLVKSKSIAIPLKKSVFLYIACLLSFVCLSQTPKVLLTTIMHLVSLCKSPVLDEKMCGFILIHHLFSMSHHTLSQLPPLLRWTCAYGCSRNNPVIAAIHVCKDFVDEIVRGCREGQVLCDDVMHLVYSMFHNTVQDYPQTHVVVETKSELIRNSECDESCPFSLSFLSSSPSMSSKTNKQLQPILTSFPLTSALMASLLNNSPYMVWVEKRHKEREEKEIKKRNQRTNKDKFNRLHVVAKEIVLHKYNHFSPGVHLPAASSYCATSMALTVCMLCSIRVISECARVLSAMGEKRRIGLEDEGEKKREKEKEKEKEKDSEKDKLPMKQEDLVSQVLLLPPALFTFPTPALASPIINYLSPALPLFSSALFMRECSCESPSSASHTGSAFSLYTSVLNAVCECVVHVCQGMCEAVSFCRVVNTMESERDVAGAMWTLRETRKLTLKDGDLDTFDMELRNTFSKHCSSLQIRPAASPALKSSNDMSVTEIYSHGLSRIPTMCTSLLCECLEGSDVADRGEGTFGHGSMLGRMASFSHSYLSLPLFPTLCSFATPSCVSLFFSSLLSLMLSTSIHLSVPRCVAESVRSLCMVADVLKNVCVRCRDDGVIEESDDYEYYYEEEEDEEEEELEPIDTQEAKDLGMDEKESGIDDATALIDEDTGTEADSDVTVDGLQSLSVSQSKGSEGEVEDDIEWFGGLTTAAVSTSFSNTVDDISPLPSFPPSLFSQTKFFVFLSTHTTMDFQRSHSLLSLFLSLFSYSRVLGHCIWEMILCTIQDVMVFMTLHKNHPFHYICSCSSLFADSFSTSSTDSPFSLLLSSIFFSLIPSLPLHSFRCATLACVSDLNHPHRLSSLFHSQIHTELCKEDQDGSVMLVKSWQKEKGESLIGQEGEERLSKVRRNIIKDVSEAKLKPLSLLFPFVLPFSSLGRPISLSYLPITLMSRVDLLAWVWGDISEKWVKLSTEEGLTWSGSVTVCEFIKYILKEHAGYTHEMSTVNGHESWNGMEEEGKEEWDECRDLLHWCGGRWERVSLIDDVTFECVFPYISTQDLCSVFSVASQEPISTVTLFNPISSLLLSPSLSSILPHLSSLLELCCESVGGAYSPLLHTLGTILTDHSNHFESLAVFTTLIEEYIHHIPFFVFPLCLDVCSSVIRSGGDGGIVGVQLIGQIIDHVTRGRSLPEAHLIRKEVASGETKEDGGEDSDVSPLSSFFQSLLFSGISLLCSSLTHPERDVCVECANRVSECAIDCILVVSEELASGIISVLCDSCIKVSKDCEKEKRSDKNRRKPRDYKVRRRELCSSAKDRVFDIHLHASNLPPASSLMGSYALKDKEVSVGCVCLCLVRRCMSAVLWKQGMRTSHPMEIPCVTPSAVSSMYLSSLACLTHAISSLTSACFSLAVCALCEIWCLMHNEMLVSIALEEEKKCKSDASVSPDESKNGLTEKESKMVRSLSYSVPQLPVNLASALFSYHSVWISISHGISISLLSSTPFFTLLSRCGLSYCDVIPLSPFSTIASVVSISVLMDRVSEGVKKKENEFYLTLLAPLSAVTPTCTHTLSLCFYIAVGLCGNERMRFKLEKLVTRVRTEAEYDEDEKRERRDVDDSELSYDFISPQDTTFLKKFYNDMVHSVEPDDIGKIPSCLPFLEHQPSVQVFSKYIQMCIAQVEFLDEASFLRSVPLLLPVLSLVIRECIRDGFVEEGALGVFVCEKLCNWCSNIEEKGGEAEMMSIWKEMEKLLFYCVNSVTHSRFVDISPPMVSVLNHIMQYIYGHTHDSELIKDVPTSLIGPLSLLLSYFALLPSCPLSPLSPPHSVEVWGTLNKCWKTNITILQDIITFGWERETLLHDEVLGATIAAEAESGEERDGEKKRNEVSLVLLQKWGKKPLPGSFSPLILVQFFLSLFFRLSLLLSSASGISEHTLEMHKDVAQLLMKIRVPQRFCSIFGMEKNSVEDGKAHIACMLPAVKVLMPVSDERVRHSCERLFDVVSRTLMLM